MLSVETKFYYLVKFQIEHENCTLWWGNGSFYKKKSSLNFLPAERKKIMRQVSGYLFTNLIKSTIKFPKREWHWKLWYLCRSSGRWFRAMLRAASCREYSSIVTRSVPSGTIGWYLVEPLATIHNKGVSGQHCDQVSTRFYWMVKTGWFWLLLSVTGSPQNVCTGSL